MKLLFLMCALLFSGLTMATEGDAPAGHNIIFEQPSNHACDTCHSQSPDAVTNYSNNLDDSPINALSGNSVSKPGGIASTCTHLTIDNVANNLPFSTKSGGTFTTIALKTSED